MEKILIFGADGMAGHVLSLYFKENYNVQRVVRNKSENNDIICDISNLDLVEKIVKDVNPQYIINASGILNTDAENNMVQAIKINTLFPHFLAKITKDTQTKVIQLSTDCIFSGKKGNYTILDTPDSDSVYGKTKALSELNNDKDLTIRTSFIGPDKNIDGIGLFNWFMKQETEITGFSNVYWAGVTTIELAKQIDQLKDKQIGLIQLTPKNKISKYELLKIMNKVWNRNLVIHQNSDYHQDKSLISSVEIEKDYEQMLIEMNLWIKKYQNIYKQY